MTTITDFASLETAITDALKDSDRLSSADKYIQLAESMFNRRLHNTEMEETSTTAAATTIAMPNGFRQVRSIFLDTDPRRVLTYMTPDQLRYFWADQTTGTPQNYSIINDEIVLGPSPDSTDTVNMTYTRTLVPLGGTNTTNWLLEKHPDLYLYASLGHAELEGWNDERASGSYLPLAEKIIDEINKEGLRRRFGTGLRVRPSVIEVL